MTITKEMLDLEYNDTLVAFVSEVNQKGAVKVLRDLKAYYPDFFDELKVQFARFDAKPLAALLRP